MKGGGGDVGDVGDSDSVGEAEVGESEGGGGGE